MDSSSKALLDRNINKMIKLATKEQLLWLVQELIYLSIINYLNSLIICTQKL